MPRTPEAWINKHTPLEFLDERRAGGLGEGGEGFQAFAPRQVACRLRNSSRIKWISLCRSGLDENSTDLASLSPISRHHRIAPSEFDPIRFDLIIRWHAIHLSVQGSRVLRCSRTIDSRVLHDALIYLCILSLQFAPRVHFHNSDVYDYSSILHR